MDTVYTAIRRRWLILPAGCASSYISVPYTSRVTLTDSWRLRRISDSALGLSLGYLIPPASAVSSSTDTDWVDDDTDDAVTVSQLSLPSYNKYESYYWSRRRSLAYLLITVSPACAYIFITTLHQLGAASRMVVQPHWLRRFVKFYCQVLNR